MELLEKHFNTAFAAPDGINKLRELILTLAMQGKLVEQDPDDQSASELLKEIETEKARLVKEKKIKKPKKLPDIKADEVPYGLPEEWDWVRFGDISQHNAGKTLDKGRNKGILRDYITTSNLYWGRFELERLRQMPIQENDLQKCLAKRNDLLICEGGEAGRAAVWNSDSEICFQNHIHRARFFGGINPYYAYRLLEKMSLTGELDHYRKGVGISNMSGKALASIPFPLPPVAEQHRIVVKIDQLMARCDELEKLRMDKEQARLDVHAAALRKLLDSQEQNSFTDAWGFLTKHFGDLYSVKENVAELRKAILQLAVMGKLVEQDPNDQPASELLKEIEAEKARLVKEKKIKKTKKLPAIKLGEIPYDLPSGWGWARLSSLTQSIDYGTSQKTCDDSTLVPVYRMGNILEGKLLDHNFKYISPKIKDLPRLYLENGDILFNRTNSYELVGKTAAYFGKDNIATLASYLIRIRLLKNKISPVYVNISMNAPYFRATQIEPDIVQQCGQANFNGTKLAHCLIPLPPYKEQHRIVSKVVQLMALCDDLEQKIDVKTSTQTKLLNAVMAQV